MKKLLAAAIIALAGSTAMADSTQMLLNRERVRNMTEAEYLAAVRDADNVNARSAEGGTPLHWAARFGTPAVVEALIQAGADGRAKDGKGQTPFDKAKYNDKLKDTDAYWKLNDARFE